MTKQTNQAEPREAQRIQTHTRGQRELNTGETHLEPVNTITGKQEKMTFLSMIRKETLSITRLI